MNNPKQFKAVTLLPSGEGEVDVAHFNEYMAVCTEDYPVLITKEQAAAFFGFDKLTEQNKIMREALESICRMNNYVDIDIAAKEALEATKC